MIKPIGFSDPLQKALLGLGGIGEAVNQSQQVRNQTARTNAELPGLEADSSQKKLGFAQSLRSDNIKNMLSKGGQDDNTKFALLAELTGTTPEMAKARYGADLTKTQNEPTLSNLDVAGKTTENARNALSLDTEQKTQPYTLEGARLKIGGMKLDNKGKAQEIDQSSKLFPSKLEDSKLQPTKTQAEINNLDANAAKDRAAAKAGPKTTADEGKAATFGRRIEQAMGEMERLASGGYNRSDLKSSAEAKFLPNAMQGSQTQQQEQAERNFINAVLRRESGASISPSEFSSAEKQYFPRAGDSDETKAQKERNRQQVLAGFQSESGLAWDKTPAIGVPKAGGAADTRKTLAEQALDDPEATEAEKAQARKILGQ